MKKLFFTLAGLCFLAAASAQTPLTILIDNLYDRSVEFDVTIQKGNYYSYLRPNLGVDQSYTSNLSLDGGGTAYFYIDLPYYKYSQSNQQFSFTISENAGGTLRIYTTLSGNGSTGYVRAEYYDNQTGSTTYYECGEFLP